MHYFYLFVTDNQKLPTSSAATTMTSSYKFFILLLRIGVICLLSLSEVVASEQKFAMEPQDQTAVVGSRVTLPCRVIGKTGTLQWTKDDFGLGTHRNLSGFDRYSMIGSDEEGKCFFFFSEKFFRRA